MKVREMSPLPVSLKGPQIDAVRNVTGIFTYSTLVGRSELEDMLHEYFISSRDCAEIFLASVK